MNRMRSNFRARRAVERRIARAELLRLWSALLVLSLPWVAMGQMGVATPLPEAERQKAAAESKASGPLANYPQLVDITDRLGSSLNISQVLMRSSLWSQ